jgi:hypothetical protein
MFHDVAEDPGGLTPEELRARYEAELRAVVEEVGVEAVVDAGVDRGTVEALAAGESPTMDLETAATVTSVRDGVDPEALAMEARDVLLMGMTTAVLDVEAIESGIGGEMEAKEIQQKVEGRFPMTLAEYATLHQYIESRKP